MAAVFRALATGGSIAVLERFKTDTFWRDVRKTGATFSIIMGSIATFLLKLPRSDDEVQTTLKSVLISPLTSEGRALAQRIGADFHTVFNMSETSPPTDVRGESAKERKLWPATPWRTGPSGR